MGENNNKCLYCVIGTLVVIGVILLVIILPLSFVTLEYYEYGFAKARSTGTVDTSTVYSGGKHFLGPNYEFKKFKADAHYLDLKEIRVFTADKLEVSITAHAQYFLRQDELPLLHDAYDIYYEDVMKTSAVDALKGAIPIYVTTELITKRPEIERVIYDAVRQRLGGKCCRPNCRAYKDACPAGCKARTTCKDSDKGLNVDVKYFQLTNIVITNDVMERLMEKLLQIEKNLREKHIQSATVIRRQTAGMVAEIKNQAKEIRETATAESQKVKVVSGADYTSTVEKARGAGLRQLYTSLGINKTEHKNSFDYLRTLRGLDNIHLTIDFQQRIAGTLK
ncbi:uncharacterized protein LOC123531754 [Mercenaria mercenaria]|uniref:uncharacterized protein LOC123531754 n=1 Tax=Mercenaria mercenaria TaxID=6596 RepID=UPI00234F33E6|nr:uncharacterized protein LOC123531754 [Mercenaria mercenaria]